MIRVEYYYLKASELLHFFLQVENWRIWHLLRCCGSYGDHVCSKLSSKHTAKRQLEKYDREEQERQRVKKIREARQELRTISGSFGVSAKRLWNQNNQA